MFPYRERRGNGSKALLQTAASDVEAADPLGTSDYLLIQGLRISIHRQAPEPGSPSSRHHGRQGAQQPPEEEEAEEEVFASHGVLEEVYAVQHDSLEGHTRLAPEAAVSPDSRPRGPLLPDGVVGALEPRDERDERAARVGLPPVDPMRSMLQQASDRVRFPPLCSLRPFIPPSLSLPLCPSLSLPDKTRFSLFLSTSVTAFSLSLSLSLSLFLSLPSPCL